MAFRLKTHIARFKANQKKLPIAIGAIARSHYLGSFRNEGFTDKTLDPWAKRKTKNRSDRRNAARRGILVNRGHLRRSIKVKRATWNRVEVGSVGIRYARFHNRGEGKLPQRQFVGRSEVLNAKIGRRIRKETKLIFR